MHDTARTLVAAAALLAALLASPALAGAQPPAASTDVTGAAQVAAASWLALVDAGDFAGSWDLSAALFRQAVTQAAWVKQLGEVRAALGKLDARKLRSSTPTDRLPDQPDGKYVVLEYDASFARKPSAIETVTTMLDPDGSWRVAGYFVR